MVAIGYCDTSAITQQCRNIREALSFRMRSCMCHVEIAMMQLLLLNDDVVVVRRDPQSDPAFQS